MASQRTVVSTFLGHLAVGVAGPLTRPLQRDVFMSLRESVSLRDNESMRIVDGAERGEMLAVNHRLRKHADYQRVYREGRKQHSPSMSYFFAPRGDGSKELAGPRVGLTAGKVLGNAVERNRIKRRLRDIVRRRVVLLDADVDIVLHPRKSVLTMDFAKLEGEVVRIFTIIQAAVRKQTEAKRAESKVEL